MSYLHSIKNLGASIEEAEKSVSRIYGLPRDLIRKKGRKIRSTQMRFAVWYLLSKVYKFPSTEIANAYGYDHTTVLNGVKRAEKLDMPKELGIKHVDKPL